MTSLPRLCAGASAESVLRAARRLMAEARDHARNGDRRAAGEAWARAGETGAYVLPGAPAGMLDAHDCKSSPRVIFQELMRWRTAPEELAEMRAQARGELRFSGLRRLSDEERELAPLTADAEREECFLLALEAEEIADARMAEAERMDCDHDRKASRRRWSSGRKRKRSDPFADIVERLPDADAEEEASNVA